MKRALGEMLAAVFMLAMGAALLAAVAAVALGPSESRWMLWGAPVPLALGTSAIRGAFLLLGSRD